MGLIDINKFANHKYPFTGSKEKYPVILFSFCYNDGLHINSYQFYFVHLNNISLIHSCSKDNAFRLGHLIFVVKRYRSIYNHKIMKQMPPLTTIYLSKM